MSAVTRVASLAIVLGALVLHACDAGAPARPRPVEVVATPPRDFASGTRLRARYHVVGGLVDVFTTFHDAELDADCAYEDASGAAHVGPGASSYCLPADMAGHRENRGPYLDSACQVRGAFAPSRGAATYALVDPRNACVTAPEVHRVGPAEVRRVFLKDDDGACVFVSEMNAHALTGPVPLGTFVRAVEEVELRPGRVGARVLVGDDGSRRVVGGFDRARGEASRVGLAADGTRRWLPNRIAFVGGGDLLFGDAQCGVPIAGKIARTATCPLSAAVVLEGTCGAGNYFELGAPISALFKMDDAKKCVVGSSIDLLAFRLGAAIPHAAYEPVVATDVGGAVVRRRGLGIAGDPAPVAWAEVVDAVTNEPCDVVATEDGTLRCMPAAVASVSLFADAACTEPAFARTVTGCEGPLAPRFVSSTDTPPRAFEITAEITALYEQTGTTCVPFTPSFASKGFAVREIDVARFPSAVLAAD